MGFLIIGILKFSLQWMVIVVVALVLSSANIIGYYKCSKDAKKKVDALMNSGSVSMAVGLGKSMLSSVISSAFGGNGTANNNNSNTATDNNSGGQYRNVSQGQP